jgi:di/tricarboxylate transporter
MSIMGALEVAIVVFLVLFPLMLIMSEMWSGMRTVVADQNVTGNNATVTTRITNLGDSFFYHMGDTTLVLIYFGLIAALFISAIYENAHPETLPIALLFIIPLILITLPLSDMSHWLYSNAGFANVAPYYQSTIYLSDNSPLITTLCTLAYVVFVITKKQTNVQYSGGSGGAGGSVVSG